MFLKRSTIEASIDVLELSNIIDSFEEDFEVLIGVSSLHLPDILFVSSHRGDSEKKEGKQTGITMKRIGTVATH